MVRFLFLIWNLNWKIQMGNTYRLCFDNYKCENEIHVIDKKNMSFTAISTNNALNSHSDFSAKEIMMSFIGETNHAITFDKR